MPSQSVSSNRQRSKGSLLFTSTVRVLFTTLIFTAGGMGLGLLLGIIGFVSYGLIAGVQPDMRNAYRHVAIPAAIAIGWVAFVGSMVLEFRTKH
jgi:amino acid transporter